MRTLTLLLFAATLPAQAPWDATVRRWRLDCERRGVVGSAFLVQRDGKTLVHEVYGHADLATARKVDKDTIFHWASITKTLTAVSIMQLRDRGLLKLDDPVVRWVPELAEVRNPFGKIEDITLRHLMSHSAGFRNPTWPWGGQQSWHPHEPTSWSQLVAMMPYTEIKFAPGSRYSYSNPGIIFLGRVIEKITGDEFEVYVEKNIFKPLGMTRSYFDKTPWHLLRHRSNNYRVVQGKPVAQGLDFDTGITVSNGGWNSPLGDLATWTGFLAGSARGEGKQVLGRDSLEEMWRPLQKIGGDGGQSMGLSFFLERRKDHFLVGHTGGQKAFISFFLLDPKSRTAGIAAFNTDGVPRPAARVIMGAVQRGVREDVFPTYR